MHVPGMITLLCGGNCAPCPAASRSGNVNLSLILLPLSWVAPTMLRLRAIAMLSAAISLSLSSPALAATAKTPCYSVAEFEAEQGVRLHTELMVVGLTCQHMDVKGETSLFNQYKLFTLKHQAQIEQWEKALVGFYKRTTKGNATRSFDSFRTRLANETSQRAIALTTPVFCASHAPLTAKVMALSMPEIKATLSPDSTGVRMANAPRCDRPQQAPLVADASAAPVGRSPVSPAGAAKTP